MQQPRVQMLIFFRIMCKSQGQHNIISQFQTKKNLRREQLVFFSFFQSSIIGRLLSNVLKNKSLGQYVLWQQGSYANLEVFFYDKFQSQRLLQEHLSLRLYKILQEHYHYVCLNIAGKFILTSVKIFQELYPYEL